MQKLFYPAAVLLALIIVISCQKEPEEIIDEIKKCRITTGYYYGGSGVMNDSAVFTYDNGKVKRIDTEYEYVTFLYSGDNISVRKKFDRTTNELITIDTIQYDGLNRITKMISWYYVDPFWWDTARGVFHFDYNGNYLKRVTEATTVFNPLGDDHDTLFNDFTINAAGNYESMTTTDVDGFQMDEVTFKFNTDPNYFKIAHPHFFLFDPYFNLYYWLVPHLPYFYSKNNVTSFLYAPPDESQISYGLDSLKQVTSVEMEGSLYVKYKYHCD